MLPEDSGGSPLLLFRFLELVSARHAPSRIMQVVFVCDSGLSRFIRLTSQRRTR